MSSNLTRGNGKQWMLFIALLPFLFFGIFYLYTKQAREDLGTMKYPRKMYPLGLDTILEGSFKRIDTVYHKVPDFNAINQFNQEISKADFNDKIIIVDFFFTSCPSICPKMSAQLERVQENFIREDKVVILSFSIDPSRDTPEKLKEYGKSYNAVPGKWHFLNADKEQIYALAQSGFKMTAMDSGGDEEHDGFVHTERFVVIDPNWIIRGYYDGTSEKDVNVMMGDLLLLTEEFRR